MVGKNWGKIISLEELQERIEAAKKFSWANIYLEIQSWGITDPIFHWESFWNLPAQFVLDFWRKTKRRKQQEINLLSGSTAALTSLIEHALSGFGKKKVDFDPKKFLPIKIIDEDSPVEQTRRELGTETIAITKSLIQNNEIRPEAYRLLAAVNELRQIFLEEDD